MPLSADHRSCCRLGLSSPWLRVEKPRAQGCFERCSSAYERTLQCSPSCRITRSPMPSLPNPHICIDVQIRSHPTVNPLDIASATQPART
ncbi:hypothetical protein EBA01_11630 [Xanthomonas oryzae pv. oryzae]|nr:hypothetical protein C0L89_11625 [Xanthomonas oryzae pv. oryzae]QBN28602.1 hypothetical protein EBA01_11630 [Xanthomonas oryzae pv. oryzae]QBN32321.1 hypothetical protein EBA02_12160 [Xanthomonas oryzae pv. oryzae]QBN35838.1 hypothetical protein EBA03_11530 [Xanthomonas oryzae pv. oryzae]QBN61347.1 hypothetical protein EBA10_11660 [Xanthomonas oryzae pv. oryzae]